MVSRMKDGGGKHAHDMASRSSAILLSTTQTAAFAGNGKCSLAWRAMVSGYHGNEDESLWHGMEK